MKSKKKKKKVLSFFAVPSPLHFFFFIFPHFPPSSSILPHFHLHFPFFYASFFPISRSKFPSGKSLGEAPPPVTPLAILHADGYSHGCEWSMPTVVTPSVEHNIILTLIQTLIFGLSCPYLYPFSTHDPDSNPTLVQTLSLTLNLNLIQLD